MAFFSLFKRATEESETRPNICPEWAENGVVFRLASQLANPSVDELLARAYSVEEHEFTLAHYLVQLAQEGSASVESDRVVVPWSQVYRLRDNPEHGSSLAAFTLPAEKRLRPVLGHQASLSEPGFDISLDGWELDGRPIKASTLTGAVHCSHVQHGKPSAQFGSSRVDPSNSARSISTS
jgi:hypothetical protein